MTQAKHITLEMQALKEAMDMTRSEVQTSSYNLHVQKMGWDRFSLTS